MKTFTVKPFENASGTTSYRVYGRKQDGTVVRENYSDQVEAIERSQALTREAMNLGPVARSTTRLTEAECREAEACFHRLTGKPLTLSQCVDYALANWNPTAKAKALQDAIGEFLAEKRSRNLRKETLGNLVARTSHLLVLGAETQLRDIGADRLRPLVFNAKWSPRTQTNEHLVFTNFFNWAMEREYVEKSPMEKINPPKVDIAEPEILTNAQCAALLKAASDYKDGAVLPYLVLSLFCAVRPKECQRLEWSNISLTERTVTIGATIAKKRGRRVVEMPDAAVAWLSANPARQLLPLMPCTMSLTRYMRAVRELANVKEWPSDVLRHTAISQRYAQTGDDAKTAKWAGNSADVIHTHYKGLVTPAETKAFWAILPDNATAPTPLANAVNQ